MLKIKDIYNKISELNFKWVSYWYNWGITNKKTILNFLLFIEMFLTTIFDLASIVFCFFFTYYVFHWITFIISIHIIIIMVSRIYERLKDEKN